jgi:hypothetical protein
MLKETMGADGDFEHRAAELKIIRGLPSDAVVPPEEVVARSVQHALVVPVACPLIRR